MFDFLKVSSNVIFWIRLVTGLVCALLLFNTLLFYRLYQDTVHTTETSGTVQSSRCTYSTITDPVTYTVQFATNTVKYLDGEKTTVEPTTSKTCNLNVKYFAGTESPPYYISGNVTYDDGSVEVPLTVPVYYYPVDPRNALLHRYNVFETTEFKWWLAISVVLVILSSILEPLSQI